MNARVPRARAIGRMLAGFIAGAIAASLFLHVSIMLVVQPIDWSIVFSLKAPFTILMGAMIIAVDAAVVAVPIIIAAEYYRLRGWLVFVGAGVGAAFVSYGLLWLVRGSSASAVFHPLLLAWLAGAGAVGGLTYWAVAIRPNRQADIGQ